MNINHELQMFVVESRYLLQMMEEALLCVEQGKVDSDIVNTIFRAAHTIKGTAGLFGLEQLVGFTHIVESVLDRVQDRTLFINGDLAGLLLDCCDHIGTLIDDVENKMAPEQISQIRCDELTQRLMDYLVDRERTALSVAKDSHQTSSEVVVEKDYPAVVADSWHISLRFGREVFRNGMDPLSFIRFLNRIGRIAHLETVFDALPPLAHFEPEVCYLGFEISFQTDTTKSEIENVFEFVREDCQICILPPHSKVSEYLTLIKSVPEEDMRLGEILLRCGSLTPSELELALQLQQLGSENGVQSIGKVFVDRKMVQPEVVDAALDKQRSVRDAKNSDTKYIRVEAQKLDHLINLVGELIIAGAGANIIAQRCGVGELMESVSAISRLVDEVRDSSLNLRMVQIGATFNRFSRVVRDVSRELKKEINLEIKGAETELDKTVVEKIGDPLTHLIRNAMDHGIELPDVRLSQGKSIVGTVCLNAYHDSGNIVIEVSDEGGGLNKIKIHEKAIAKGLVAADQNLSDQEIYQLIFEPGFSTAEQVTNLSGRGVGMDVVRRNIEELRGTIEVDSVYGVGSVFRIRLPLTLAIIDGFLVNVSGISYVIPLEMVVECIEMNDKFHKINGNDESNYMNLRGEVLPCLRLKELFKNSGRSVRRENVVVVQYGCHRAGLVVDELLGEFHAVIKPQGRIFSKTQGVAGFTILGGGEVAMVLDVPALASIAVRRNELMVGSMLKEAV